MEKQRKANAISKTSFCSRRSRSGVHCQEMKIGWFVTAVLFFGLAQTKAAAQSEHNVVVAADGSGHVKTVQAAIDKIPKHNWKRIVIFIKPGIYNEQVQIPPNKPYVSLRGEKAEETKITFNVKITAGSSDRATCTAFIGGHDVHVENITFENSFGPGAQAFAVVANADRLVFKNCRFLGWHDTLYAKAGRQYFDNCYIEGSYDFIFGQATAVFENCTLHSKAYGYIAAPMRFSAVEPSGLVFIRCKLTAEKVRNEVFLGRPWRPYGRAIYIESEIGAHIHREGWDNKGNPSNEKTAYFAEYNCKGPGANRASRVKWSRQLEKDEARQFETENFLKGQDGWNPKKANEHL
jgi:pectinesterase